MALDLAVLVGAPRPLRLRVYRGEAPSWRIGLLDELARGPLDLTGAVVRFTVREDLEDDPTVAASVGEGITVADQVAFPGELDLALGADVFAGLPATEYLWDLWLGDELVVPPSPLALLEAVELPGDA